MGVKLNTGLGGSITIDATNTASNVTATLPAVSGTVAVSGNIPAFSAFRSGSHQTISSSTWTKVQLNSETFDTANCYDPTTNYRFTPNVAGYYQINFSIYAGNGTNQAILVSVFKNGVGYVQISNYASSSGILDDWNTGGSTLVYLNGSTDYIELYAYIVGSAVINLGNGTYMDGFLARTA